MKTHRVDKEPITLDGPNGEAIEVFWRADLEGFQVRGNYEQGGTLASVLLVRPEVANTIIVRPSS